jgi:metal-sulfur cluster biosynthetic enzyme
MLLDKLRRKGFPELKGTMVIDLSLIKEVDLSVMNAKIHITESLKTFPCDSVKHYYL